MDSNVKVGRRAFYKYCESYREILPLLEPGTLAVSTVGSITLSKIQYTLHTCVCTLLRFPLCTIM